MKCQIFFLGLLFVVINEIKGKSDLKTSLTFVIDDTGSMGNDIAEVKRGANAIFDTVMNSNASHIEDFILVTFNDPGELHFICYLKIYYSLIDFHYVWYAVVIFVLSLCWSVYLWHLLFF